MTAPTTPDFQATARHHGVAVRYSAPDIADAWIKIWCARCGAPREPHGKYPWKCGERMNCYGIEQAAFYLRALGRKGSR